MRIEHATSRCIAKSVNELRYSMPLTSGIATKILYKFLISPMHAVCPLHLTFLHLLY
jgi:hypothetical protein